MKLVNRIQNNIFQPISFSSLVFNFEEINAIIETKTERAMINKFSIIIQLNIPEIDWDKDDVNENRMEKNKIERFNEWKDTVNFCS